jgi:predicted enzyme related to lactoylglutathione lyase
MQQAINRLDHLAILVKYENIEKYKKHFSDVLGIVWDEAISNDSAGVIAVPSWDSGLELIAPMRPEGRYWERIQKFGEGTVTIVFGVPDLDAAIKRAGENGAPLRFNIVMTGDEPWLSRFKTFREAKIDMFPEEFAATVTLSQIEPHA